MLRPFRRDSFGGVVCASCWPGHRVELHFNDGDVVSGLGCIDGGGHAGDASTDHEDFAAEGIQLIRLRQIDFLDPGHPHTQIVLGHHLDAVKVVFVFFFLGGQGRELISGMAPNHTFTQVDTLDDTAGGRFKIDSVSGVVTVDDGTLLNREAAASHNITVRATSSDGSFDTAVMTINLNDVDEFDVTTPTDSDVTVNAVDENAANGTAVGIPASAADADATTNTVTYSLFDDAGGRFSIDTNTGIVTVNNGIVGVRGLQLLTDPLLVVVAGVGRADGIDKWAIFR